MTPVPSMHSTNKDQRRVTIAIVGRTASIWWGWTNNTSKCKQYKRTPCSFRTNTTIPVPFHIFHNRRSTQRRHYCILFVQHIKVRLRPPNTNDTVKFEHARSNTNVHTVRAAPARQRFIHYSGQHMMRAGLWPHTTSNTDNTHKFERTHSNNRNVRAVRLEPPWHQAVP